MNTNKGRQKAGSDSYVRADSYFVIGGDCAFDA